jgi:hypothetical protein
MPRANINDRATLESVYSESAFARDATWNERPDAVRRGVRLGSAPDTEGWFELERAKRHTGEPETPHFLTPVRRAEELIERGHHDAARQVSTPQPANGYAEFLDDIVAAAERFGFRAEDSPGRDEPRLKGFRGG